MISQPGGHPGVTMDLARLSITSSGPTDNLIHVTLFDSHSIQQPQKVRPLRPPKTAAEVTRILDSKYGPGELVDWIPDIQLHNKDVVQAGRYKYIQRRGTRAVLDTVKYWKWFMTKPVLEQPIPDLPETAPDDILANGYTNPHDLVNMELTDLCALLRCDDKVAEQVVERCTLYSKTYTREQLLAKSFQPRYISIYLAAQSQKDANISLTLKYCKWEIRPELADFRRSLVPTAPLFVAPGQPHGKGAAGEPSVDDTITQTVNASINRLLQFDAILRADREGCAPPPYNLQRQKRGSIPESLMKAIDDMSKLQQRGLARQKSVEQANQKRTADWSLCRTKGYDRAPAVVGDSKRVEKLMIVLEDGEAVPEYALNMPGYEVKVRDEMGQVVRTVYAPDVFRLLGPAGSRREQEDKAQEDLRENVEAVVKQVACYCKDAGVRYGFFTNHYYTWGVKLENGSAHISQAVPCTATNPSVLLLLYYICTKGVEEAEAREAAAVSNQGSQNSAEDNPDSDQRGPPGDDDAMNDDDSGGSRDVAPDKPRRSARLTKSGTAQQQPAAEAAEVLVSCDQQQATAIVDLDAAAAAARLIDLNLVDGFVGTGWTGFVFAYEMPDGMSAALKVAAPDSDELVSLYQEAVILLALRRQWGKWVAGLLAAGIGKDGHSAVLAVERISDCSHLAPGSDRDVLPQLEQALGEVHSHGVAHKDIRCENILVQRLADGGKKVWLIDWGFAVLNATPEQQQEDWRRMHRLFGITC